MVENDGPAEDVRDDEATRAAEPAPAELPRRVPTPPRGGDGARAEPAAGTGIDDLQARLAEAERARAEAETARDEAVRRAESLAVALADARAQPTETFGMRADKVVRMAEHEAAQRLRAAEQEAARLTDAAHAESERVAAAARTDAERVTAAARAEADRIAAEAATEADRTRAAGVAVRRDSELVADTAASMHAHVAELRGTLRAEIARLHALLGAELGRIDGRSAPPSRPDRAPAGRVPADRDGGAHTLRAGAGEPSTGELPAVSLPAPRAADPADPGAPAGDDAPAPVGSAGDDRSS